MLADSGFMPKSAGSGESQMQMGGQAGDLHWRASRLVFRSGKWPVERRETVDQLKALLERLGAPAPQSESDKDQDCAGDRCNRLHRVASSRVYPRQGMECRRHISCAQRGFFLEIAGPLLCAVR